MTIASMAQPTPMHHDRHREVVLGVDTHKDAHVAAMVSTTGRLIGSRSFPATADGYQQLLDWARSHGTVDRAGVECTGSYGAALSRFLRGDGLVVIEVNQPDKATRRRRGKTDTIDAEAAAHAVLSGRATATAKHADGPAEALRLLREPGTGGPRTHMSGVTRGLFSMVTGCAEAQRLRQLSRFGNSPSPTSSTWAFRCAVPQEPRRHHAGPEDPPGCRLHPAPGPSAVTAGGASGSHTESLT